MVTAMGRHHPSTPYLLPCALACTVWCSTLIAQDETPAEQAIAELASDPETASKAKDRLVAMGDPGIAAVQAFLVAQAPARKTLHGKPEFWEDEGDLWNLGVSEPPVLEAVQPQVSHLLTVDDSDPHDDIEEILEYFGSDAQQLLFAMRILRESTAADSPETIQALGGMLGHEEASVAHAAARYLAQAGAPAIATLAELVPDAHRGWLAAAALAWSQQGRDTLVAMLDGARASAQTRIVSGLAAAARRHGSPDLARLFGSQLDARNSLRARMAAWSLGQMPPEMAIPEIRRALRSDSARARLHASAAAAFLGPNGAHMARDVLAWLEDAPAREASYGMQALGMFELRGPQATRAAELLVRRMTEDPTPQDLIALSALGALAKTVIGRWRPCSSR